MTQATSCTGPAKEAKRKKYGCTDSQVPVVLPSTAMIGFSIFDLDKGVNGTCVEKVNASEYSYFVAPLRASSGNSITSTVLIDREAGTFVSGAIGSTEDNPSDPKALTDDQASKAVQLF